MVFIFIAFQLGFDVKTPELITQTGVGTTKKSAGKTVEKIPKLTRMAASFSLDRD